MAYWIDGTMFKMEIIYCVPNITGNYGSLFPNFTENTGINFQRRFI